MRWNLKKHESGYRKVKRKFAFVPTIMDSPKYEVVWLGWYYRVIEYRENNYLNVPYEWIIVKTYI